jgi:hypothetical protein
MDDDKVPVKIVADTPAKRPAWSHQLTKAAAILGAFFAAGQTASQVVQG